MLERASRVGAAIIVLVVTLTIWNAMEYQRRLDTSDRAEMAVAGPFDPSTARLLSPAEERAAEQTAARKEAVRMAALRERVAPAYVEREVLILGVGLAAWLLLHRGRKRA
jgi:hypothetical protein